VVVPVKAGDPLKPREIVVGVRIGDQAKAYPLPLLQQQSPVQDVLGGVPIVLVVLGDGRSVRAFERHLEGRQLSLFAKPGSTPPRLVDAETGSEWDLTGAAVGGPLAGKKLAKVFVLKDYWFDWKAYNPGTRIYSLTPQSR
jgi:uncharacterized protein DUF3179